MLRRSRCRRNKQAAKDGEILSDADNKIIKDIESMQADLQFVAKAAKDRSDKRQEILQTLAPKYDKVLKDLIQIDQIDMILAPSALQYANDKTIPSRS